jgi:hypothetical protein
VDVALGADTLDDPPRYLAFHMDATRRASAPDEVCDALLARK